MHLNLLQSTQMKTNLTHSYYDGYYRKNKRLQVLARVWRKGDAYKLLWECKLVQSFWKTVWQFLKKVKLELSYDSAEPLLGIYQKEMKSHS